MSRFRLATRYAINDLGGRLDEVSGPFMDTAAVMMNLDLVVTSDTATAPRRRGRVQSGWRFHS